MDSERMGSPGGRVCEILRGLPGCSVRRAHCVGYGQAEHMCSLGEPLETRGLLWNAQSDVMAARVVGIRQEGLNPCRMVPSRRDEVQGARTAAMTSRARCKVREPSIAALVRRL